MAEKQYNWAEYKRAERGHAAGNHFYCGEKRDCTVAARLYQLNYGRLLFRAIFERLSDPAAFFGDQLGQAERLASAELPDYPYLDTEPDFLHRMQANCSRGEALQLLEFYLQYVEE